MEEVLKRETRFRRINRFVLPLYIAAAAVALGYNLWKRDFYAALQGGLGLLLFPVPLVLGRLLHCKIPQDAKLLYLLFVFGTVIIGSAFYGYARIPYWDKIFHFFSGFLFAAVGLVVWQLFTEEKHPQGRGLWLALLFCTLFNISVAAVWVMYEYALFFFFGIDAVNTLTTGVNDTMQDMIVCTLGGLLLLISAYRYWCLQKPSFLLGICRQFFALNPKKSI